MWFEFLLVLEEEVFRFFYFGCLDVGYKGKKEGRNLKDVGNYLLKMELDCYKRECRFYLV